MKKRTGLAVALMSMAMPAGVAMAEPSNAELYEMIQKMSQELSETKAENQELRKMMESSGGTGGAVVDDYDETQAVKSKPIALKPKLEESYLKVRSSDGNIEYKIDGRIMLDAGFVDNNKEDELNLRSNTEFRRARLAFKTRFYKDWTGEFDIDVSGIENTTEEVAGDVNVTHDDGEDPEGEFKDDSDYQKLSMIEVKDMWVAYEGFHNTIIKVGNHKAQFSMDEVTTSRWGTFMESAMVSEFGPGRNIGLSVAHYQDLFFVAAGVFGDNVLFNPTDGDRAERLGWSGRAAVRPFLRDDANKVFHIGANYLDRPSQSEENGKFKYSSRPEAHFVDYKYLDTGKISDVEDVTTWGVELAGKWDRFHAQSEYMQSTVNVTDRENPEFDGWYVQASYFLTDDSRPYNLSDAEFGAVKPNGKMGAFELALRYSTLDLNDEDADRSTKKKHVGVGVNGGTADNITVGLNWYVNNNVIFRANYIHVNNGENAGADNKLPEDDDLNIYGTRLEYLF